MTRMTCSSRDNRMTSMSRCFAPLTGLALVSLFSAGCFSTDLDPNLGGVFVCESSDADSCPSTLICVNQRCETAQAVPTLSVLGPEDNEILETTALDVPVGPPADPFELTIRIQGTLDLVSANSGSDHEFGEGHVAVFVDGEEQLIVDNGSISAAASIDIEVENTPGAHRIALQARRNDGTAYDNPEARATRLFWLESELTSGQRPFVAIKTPWPGDDFPLEQTTIDIEVATLNFDLEGTGSGEKEGSGHAHIYYDVELPECVRDTSCDGSYLGVASDSPTTTILAPASQALNTTITAVLRHVGHAPYGIPFECDPRVDMPPCVPVFDEIEISRVDN